MNHQRMATYYDIHNHLFNKHFLAKELLYRLMKELQKLLGPEEKRERDLRDTSRGLKKAIRTIKRFRKAIRVFTRPSSVAIYEELNKTYKGNFILTPLTFDLTWCFTASAGRGSKRQYNVNELVDNEFQSLFKKVEAPSVELSRGFMPGEDQVDEELWKEYQEEKELLLKEAEELRDPEHMQGRSFTINENAGWEEQLRQIEELKKHPEYGDKVFPFLAVDPRREGIVDYAKAHVGKGKLFAGIKLYCPNGYSPTDPKLFGLDGRKDGLYGWCEKNRIPVTVHNSDGGFATISRSVFITGLVLIKGKLRQLTNQKLTFRNAVTGKNGISERAQKLNHPLIWEKVVEKYPELILNLAHFGGGRQLDKALEHPDDNTLWSNRIISLIKDKRYRVYTDVSCFTEMDILRKLTKSPVYPAIRKKILYGSDYTLLLLFEDDFDRNVDQFMTIFGSDFEIIAGKNPKQFLKYVI